MTDKNKIANTVKDIQIEESDNDLQIISTDEIDMQADNTAEAALDNNDKQCSAINELIDNDGKKVKPKKMKKINRTNIGGQAVLEGVMMMGAKSMATAVRDENGEIQIESLRTKPIREKSVWRRVPFVRGVLNFATTMYMGVKVLLRSSAVFDGETEPTKFDKWCAKKLHVDAMSILMTFSVLVGVGLAIALFFVLPHFIIEGCKTWWGDSVHGVVYSLIEGVIRIVIFVLYITLASLMKEIKRTFMYHGAEHKTISCYEYGLPLTIDNVQKQSTIHDRCGTTFMFIVMVIAILVFSFTGFLDLNMGYELLIKIALLPVVAGVSYEILKFLAKFDNWFVKCIKAPGLLLQKVTTKQPTDEMVEVAIAAFTTVLNMDNDDTIESQTFNTKVLYKDTRAEMDEILKDIGDGNADADWIAVDVLGVKRSELHDLTHIRSHKADKMIALARERASGKPLQQVLGNTEFYGLPFIVTSDVLCPRPETEYLVESALKIIADIDAKSVLDLCTGSGAIAIAIKKLNSELKVAASDVSKAALSIARQNSEKNGVCVDFTESDLFENISGKYDFIISNPPYIKSEEIANLDDNVKEYEPHIALDGGVDGYDFYNKIIPQAKNFLNTGGYLAFEVGLGQADTVAETMEANGYMNIEIKRDLERNDRIVIGRTA